MKKQRKTARLSRKEVVSKPARVTIHKLPTGVPGLDDILIITDGVDRNLTLSVRNLHRVDVIDVAHINPVVLLSFEKVLLTAPAVKKLEAWLS